MQNDAKTWVLLYSGPAHTTRTYLVLYATVCYATVLSCDSDVPVCIMAILTAVVPHLVRTVHMLHVAKLM